MIARSNSPRCANRLCKLRFSRGDRHPFAIACSVECEIALAVTHIQKIQESRRKASVKAAAAERKTTKLQLQRLRGLSYWEGVAQHAINKYARVRDADLPCISCGITYSSIWHGGHFISVGANSTLRFVEENINKQCVQCNFSKGGNALLYRIAMLSKYGIEIVEKLESFHAPVKKTISECIEIKKVYDEKTKYLLALHQLNMESA